MEGIGRPIVVLDFGAQRFSLRIRTLGGSHKKYRVRKCPAEERRGLETSILPHVRHPPRNAAGVESASMTRRGFGLTAAAAALAARLQAAPQVCVRNVRRAFHNGEHNAFTDLTWFQGRIYLTFRSCPEGHMIFPSSTIRVLESEDLGQSWREVHSFSAPKRDVRDPHFLVFDDKLFVYSGTWYCGDGPPKVREANQMLGGGAAASLAGVPALDPIAGLFATLGGAFTWKLLLAWSLPLLLSLLAGRVFCAFCAAPFAKELAVCPHCGAPVEDARPSR